MRVFMNGLRATAMAAGLALAPAISAAETLAQALASAYEHNGLLEQNRALLRAADEDVAATFALLRPIVSWTASIGSNYTDVVNGAIISSGTTNSASLGLAAEVLLFDNGATRLSVAAAEETVLATRQALVSAEQTVLFDAVQAFMNVLRDREIVRLSENNLRLLERELQAARDRFEVGEVTRTDVALAEARLAASQADLARARGNVTQSEVFYVAAIGHRPGSLVVPRGVPQVPGSLDEATNVSIRVHPQMRQIQYEISAAELNVKRAEAVMAPTIKLRGALSASEEFGNSDHTYSGSVSLEASQIIYQGGRLSALLRRAMAQRDALRGAMHVVRHALRQQTGNAWATLEATTAQLRASDQRIDASRIAFEGVREEATLGSRTTLDVLIAEQDLLDAQTSRVTAQAAQYTAVYALLSAMGLLTADHLGLAVQKYDPEAYFNLVKDAPTARSKRGQKLDEVIRALGKE